MEKSEILCGKESKRNGCMREKEWEKRCNVEKELTVVAVVAVFQKP